MIGGQDIVIPAPSGPATAEMILKETSSLWPQAHVEDAQTGEVLTGADRKELIDREELLIYKDVHSAELWYELGADESLTGTMIHVLLASDAVTLVVDSTPSTEIRALVASIRQKLQQGAASRNTKIAT